MSTPPAWHPDPVTPTLLRFWDGVAWTEHTAPAPVLAPAPAPAGFAPPQPSSSRWRRHYHPKHAADHPGHLPGSTPMPGSARHAPATAPAASMPAAPRPMLGAGFRRLATLLVTLLAFEALLAALLLALNLYLLVVVRDVADGGSVDLPMLKTLDLWGTWALWGQLLLIPVTGLLWVIWQARLAGSAQVHPSFVRRAPGLHLGAWLIPVLSLWWPPQNVADLYAGARAPRERDGSGTPRPAGRIPTPTILVVWWSAWLVQGAGTVVVTLWRRSTRADTSLEHAALLCLALAVLQVVMLIGAMAATGLVWRISDGALVRLRDPEASFSYEAWAAERDAREAAAKAAAGPVPVLAGGPDTPGAARARGGDAPGW